MIIEIRDDKHKTMCFNTKDILTVSLKRNVDRDGEGFNWELNIGMRNTGESWEYLSYTSESAARDIYGALKGHMKESALDKRVS